jgi:hypothetical protein
MKDCGNVLELPTHVKDDHGVKSWQKNAFNVVWTTFHTLIIKGVRVHKSFVTHEVQQSSKRHTPVLGQLEHHRQLANTNLQQERCARVRDVINCSQSG